MVPGAPNIAKATSEPALAGVLSVPLVAGMGMPRDLRGSSDSIDSYDSATEDAQRVMPKQHSFENLNPNGPNQAGAPEASKPATPSPKRSIQEMKSRPNGSGSTPGSSSHPSSTPSHKRPSTRSKSPGYWRSVGLSVQCSLSPRKLKPQTWPS